MARYAPLGSVEGRPVSNRDTRAAWNYHNGTKHPSGHLLDRSHVFNPMSPPTPFKVYAGVETLPLAPDMATLGVPALSAISTNRAVIDGDRTPDIDVLARILYFSAGITKRIGYPWGEMAFRAAACTGGLYHIELYVVCGELPGLEAGVYNFDPRGPGLQRLRKGDYRGVLADAAGEEHSLTHAPAVRVYTDVFWRNSCKYQAREYRHAFWDSGTIMANTLAICSAHEMTARVVTSLYLGFGV